MAPTVPDPPSDAAGTRHPPAGPMPRIVSLVPSLTELLFDLGLGERVVGRTHFCIHPPAVAAVPSLGGTKKIRLDRLRALAPTHVLVNVDETPQPLAAAIAALGTRVIVTHPNEPLDNLALYRLLGFVFDRAGEAAALAERFRAAYGALAAAARDWPGRRVLYLIWRDPWMTVSRETYIARTLALVRWCTIGDDPADDGPARRYPALALDETLRRGVDLVLFSSEPYRFTERDVAAFRAAQGPDGPQARLIDGEMTSWYGSRAIRGLDYLRQFAAP